MIIINDTPVRFSDFTDLKYLQGGTSSFLTGFLRYLLQRNRNAKLIGNFQNYHDSSFQIVPVLAKSNISFLVKLAYYFVFSSEKVKYGLFYCQRPDHLAITLISKGKHVVHLHGQPYTTMNAGRSRIRKFVYNRLEKYAMPRADLVIATDSRTAELYTSLYPVIKPNLQIIPTGISLTYFDPGIAVQQFPGIKPNTSNLVYIGRLVYPKQVSIIIAAFIKAQVFNPSLHLWIAGIGPDEQKLRYIASKSSCRSNIHFVGLLSRDNVRSLIHSSDAGILLSNHEGSPIVVKEFLASGKPVIVNNVGDVNQYVKNGVNGYIVDLEQIESIVEAIQNTVFKAKHLADNCRTSVLPYAEELIFEEIYELHMKLQKNE